MKTMLKCLCGLMGLSLFLLLVGCNGGGSLAIGDICPEMEKGICDFFERCDYAWSMQLDQHLKCEETFQCDDEEMQEMQAAVDAGRIAYDGQAARACMNILKSSDCADIENIFGEGAEECEMVFTGLVSTGGECYDGDECTSGHYCDETLEKCPGECVAYKQIDESCEYDECDPDVAECSWQLNICVELGDVGDSCEDVWCKEGLECDYESYPQVCFEPGSAGDSCEFIDHCSGVLFCIDGVCTGPAGQGQTCNVEDFDNFPFVCQAGLYCDADLIAQEWEGTCQSKKGTGLECLLYFECESGLLCIGAEINPETQQITPGACGQPLGVGQECGALMELPECDYDLYCDEISQTCVAYPRVGDTCIYGVYPDCLGSDVYCDSLETGVEGTCRAQKQLGETCTRYEECESWSCVDGVCVPGDICQP
jgi:hypothetical protein